MEITGRIIHLMEPRTGDSKTTGKKWMSQDYVLETQGKFQKKMLFTVFGEENIKRYALHEGYDCVVQFDIDAHEYNGRWYNSITAFNVMPIKAPAPALQPQPAPSLIPPQPTLFAEPPIPQASDDLPF